MKKVSLLLMAWILIVKENYGQIYGHKFDELEGVDEFLIQKLTK